MKSIAKVLFLAAITVYAQDAGLKDVYSSYFKFGSILNGTTVNNAAMKNLVLKEFNSITPENELKPDQTIVCNGSTNTNIKVELKTGAKNILKFCEDNNIPMRGHTLVWHSQTPTCFFKDNFTDGGNWVTAAIMDQRMESYIKNMFAAIKKDYPNLNLYAYDVVNEAAKQSGAGPRDAGDNSSGEGSMWVRIYGGNSFIKKAFQYARQYAPATTKLFYNDFNEYMSAKRDYIVDSILKPNFQAGNLDGMGMQSHLDVRQGGTNAWPSANEYKQAIQKFKGVGVEVQVTELDATLPEGGTDFVAQAVYYRDIMKAIIEERSAITAVVVWGIQDDQSWRSKKSPLLFNSSGNKKAAYDSVYVLAPKPTSSSSGVSSSSSIITQPSSSSSTDVAQACGEYETSFCGGMDFANVQDNSTEMPATGECLFIGDFKVIQPALNSTVSINGAENTCGEDWDDCPWNTVPGKKDGGYYVYVKDGSINSHQPADSTQPNGWKDIAAKAKITDCGATPVLTQNPMPQTIYSIKYYTLKGEPLGNKLPSKSGVYIVREGYSVKKIVVR